ncbi:MAG: UDP-N-acetylmuramate dehydrogenase [Thermosulfidibacteraceae bacterium]|jgi:UDP-N-acetylmuramate dehydrogenase
MQRTFEGIKKKDFELKNISLVATKGRVRYFFEPFDLKSLIDVLKFLKKEGIPFLVVGNSSNILWGDGYFDGAVVTTRKVKSFEIIGNKIIKVSCGLRIMELIRITCNLGLSGVEELSGIPGTIGGALVMNAGAFGKSIGDVVRGVYIFNGSDIDLISRNGIEFCYRKSSLDGVVVLGAIVELNRSAPAIVAGKVDAIIRKRREKFPMGSSLGSVFKNPPGDYAGRLIELAGLKGYRIGSAKVSEKHANFFISDRGGCARDYFELVNFVKSEVFEKFGVYLEEEIKYAGVF